MDNMRKTLSENSSVQNIAEIKQTEIVQKAADQIISLKEQVSDLKKELYAKDSLLQVANSINDAAPFNIKGTGR
jgi:hypothetical protein